MIAGLLSGQRADGGFGLHPYSKWKGAHWRLVSLVELGIPRTNRAARNAANTVLDWIAEPDEPRVVRGLERRHASMEGNALAVCCRLGMARDRRVRHLVEVLLRAQWPDGGWNCRGDLDADRKSTRLNSSHVEISYAVFCLKKKKPAGHLLLPQGATAPKAPGRPFNRRSRI